DGAVMMPVPMGSMAWRPRRIPASIAFLYFPESGGDALQGIGIAGVGAAPRGSLYLHLPAGAHGLDHFRLGGLVLDPGRVVLRQHAEPLVVDAHGDFRSGLQRIAHDRLRRIAGALRRDEHKIVAVIDGVWLRLDGNRQRVAVLAA